MRATSATPAFDVILAAETVRRFMSAYDQIRIWEGGLLAARLTADDSGFSLRAESGRLVCHFWTGHANLVRRVVGIAEIRGQRLRLQCLRMGQPGPTPLILEGSCGPYEDRVDTALAREDFRQVVVAAARRDWPEWHCAPGGPASALSPVQRLVFTRGRSVMAVAALAADESPTAMASLLTQALLWVETVAEAYPGSVLAGLRLVVPAGAEEIVRWRLPWLRPTPAIECYRLDVSAAQLNRLPLSDTGNVDSSLCRAPSAEVSFSPAALAVAAQVAEHCPDARLHWSGGGCAVHVNGMPVVAQTLGAEALVSEFFFGYGRERTPLLPSTQPEFENYLQNLRRHRGPDADGRHPLYQLQPERWLEQKVRDDPTSIDPRCDPRFVYSQVPVVLPGQRDVLDLLAVDRDGRLLVWELKAGEDAGFPLQALDYWMRVRHHHRQGDFTRLGYFPGVRLSELPPRLCLIAPALRWHPGTTRLLRWIAPEVGLERAGINENWRQGLRVLTRWHDAIAGSHSAAD